MIIVVEGLSAVGKTTLLRSMPPAQVVVEAGVEIHQEDGQLLPPAPGQETPQFWVNRQMQRWRRLLDIERQYGRAYADTDPIKLHYAFGLALIGARARDAFDAECEVIREAMTAGQLGFADHIVLLSAPPEVLAARKAADATKPRHNFALHARLGPSLAAYYASLERLRPNTVHHIEVDEYTQTEDASAAIQRLDATRPGRYDVEVLRQFKHALDRKLEGGKDGIV